MNLEIGETKELNIENQTYYYLDDIIDIRNFHSNFLKIDKKPYKDIDIYYIGYITIKKFGDCENIHSANPLYLIFHSATVYFKENCGEKYLILDLTEKYEEVFSGIKSEIFNCFSDMLSVILRSGQQFVQEALFFRISFFCFLYDFLSTKPVITHFYTLVRQANKKIFFC